MFASAERCEPLRVDDGIVAAAWDSLHNSESRSGHAITRPAASGARSSCAPWRGCRRPPCRTTRPSGCGWRRRTPTGRRGCGRSSSVASGRPRSMPRRSPAVGPSAPATPAASGASDTVPPGSNRGRSPHAAASASSLRLDASGSARPAFTPARSRRASRTTIAASRSASVTPAPDASSKRPRSQAAERTGLVEALGAVLEARRVDERPHELQLARGRGAPADLSPPVHVCRSTLPSTATRR